MLWKAAQILTTCPALLFSAQHVQKKPNWAETFPTWQHCLTLVLLAEPCCHLSGKQTEIVPVWLLFISEFMCVYAVGAQIRTAQNIKCKTDQWSDLEGSTNGAALMCFVCVGKKIWHVTWTGSLDERRQKLVHLIFLFLAPSLFSLLVIMHSDFDPELCLLSQLSLLSCFR